jgi:DNA-directed RNA polymerase specialized sigma24 family protein
VKNLPDLEQVLSRLDRRSRLVLTLQFVEGLTEEETAAALDLPPARVRALSEDALVALMTRGRTPAARRAA